MPIKPIDIYTMPPRSQEASNQQQNNLSRLTGEEMQMNNQFQKDVKQNTQRAVKADKKEDKEFKFDAKEKGNNEYSGNKKKKQKRKPEDSLPPMNGSSFDITI